MIRKLLVVSMLLVVAFLGYAQENRPKVIVRINDPARDINNQTFELSKGATVSFEKYKLQRPADIDTVNLGLSVLWCSRNYYVSEDGANNEADDELFSVGNADFVAEDWGELYDEPWRIPTKEEFEELFDPNNCDWVYDSDMNRFKVKSKINNNYIYISCAGLQENGKERSMLNTGNYWTSPLDFDATSRNGDYFEIRYDENARFDKLTFTPYSDSRTTRMSIRPVYGEPQSKAKPLVQHASAQDYRSAIIEVSVENVDYDDIIDCGVYYHVNESYLPTNQKPNALQAYTKTTSLNANNTAEIYLDDLTSGAIYYVCAYVTTEKGATFSETTSFTVDGMTVNFASMTPKSVGQETATLTLNLQGNPLRYITKYGVMVTGGDLESEEYAIEKSPSNVVADVELTGLTSQTQYTCIPFAIFNNDRIEGNTPIIFSTDNPRPVNEKFPIPTSMIDLGLSVKWAPYNMGDKDETGIGDGFYGWGDPTGEATQTGNTAQYADGSGTPGPEGYEYDIAGTEYDIATVQWQDKWHLPSKADFQELYDNCVVSEEKRNGRMGLLFKNKYGKTDEELWLPLPGGRSWNGASSDEDVAGYYWTSETSAYKDSYRLRLQKAINDGNFELKPRGTRGSIRPVYGDINRGSVTPPPVIPPEPGEDGTVTVGGYNTDTVDGAETAYPKEAVDMGLPSSTKWAAWNVGAMEYGDLGKYYAWGETTTKETFTSGTYVASVKGYQIYDLPSSADVARQLWGKGGSWVMPGEEDFGELFESEPITVYVLADEAPYIYGWDDSGEVNGKWPGMKLTTKDDSKKFWKCTFSADSVNIIINGIVRTLNDKGEILTTDTIQSDSIIGLKHSSYFTFNPSIADKKSNWTDITDEYYTPGTLHYVFVKWETDSVHGYHNGLRVISRSNGNSIFFPAGGEKTTRVNGLDSQGWYWSKSGSSLTGKRQSHAICFNFGLDSNEPDGMYHVTRNLERFDGCMVRPVWKENSGARELKTP